MANESRHTLLKDLPSVDEVLRSDELSEFSHLSAHIVTEVIRLALEGFRSSILDGSMRSLKSSDVFDLCIKKLTDLTTPGLRRVVNASGTVLHTNLGRSVLCEDAVDALTVAATGTVNVELDIESGLRGSRDSRVETLLTTLTGAEAACVVNNNAAAVLITLNTLSEGRVTVVSRGEQIEIGGSFRLPEIIGKSGCIMKEVGTTNRTHPSDYSQAIMENTAVLLKAHRSNYDVTGFVSEVSLKELAQIGQERGVAVVEDLGSGSLVNISDYGLKKEPLVSESIAAGADVVTFSGDKLLGGPQAGLICGKKAAIDSIRKNPLKRALRADKLTLAALEATLMLYLSPESLPDKLPALKYLVRPVKDVEAIAKKAVLLLKKRLGRGYTIRVIDGESLVGSGSLPGYVIPTRLIAISHDTIHPGRIFMDFLSGTPAILGRVGRDEFLLDMRAIDDATQVCPSESIT